MCCPLQKQKALERSNGRGSKRVKIRLYLPVSFFLFICVVVGAHVHIARARADRDLRLRPTTHLKHLTPFNCLTPLLTYCKCPDILKIEHSIIDDNYGTVPISIFLQNLWKNNSAYLSSLNYT